MDNGISLSDIAAVLRNDENGYGNGWIWIFVLFILFAGGNGWNNRCNSDVATKDDVAAAVWQQTNDGMLRSLTYGLSDSTFALNNAVNGVGTQVMENKYELSNKVDNCCCTTQRNIDSVRYDMSLGFCNTNAHIDEKFNELNNRIYEREVAARDTRINQLELQAAMYGVVRYPNGFTYTAGQSPFCGCGCGAASI